ARFLIKAGPSRGFLISKSTRKQYIGSTISVCIIGLLAVAGDWAVALSFGRFQRSFYEVVSFMRSSSRDRLGRTTRIDNSPCSRYGHEEACRGRVKVGAGSIR